MSEPDGGPTERAASQIQPDIPARDDEPQTDDGDIASGHGRHATDDQQAKPAGEDHTADI